VVGVEWQQFHFVVPWKSHIQFDMIITHSDLKESMSWAPNDRLTGRTAVAVTEPPAAGGGGQFTPSGLMFDHCEGAEDSLDYQWSRL
jgi:hypothetical protein